MSALGAILAEAEGDCPGKADSAASPEVQPGGTTAEPAVIYDWEPICNQQAPYTTGGQGLCRSDQSCPEGQQLMRKWRIKPLPRVPGDIACMPTAAADKPEITPGMVLEAFRAIALPTPATVVQPADTTLVNLDTIFHTDAGSFERTVTLLGQSVHLAIRPSSFHWVFGDGTDTTTTTPGAAYPSKAITHRYLDAHTTVSTHVVITWSADYTVNGGPIQPVPGTAETTGPDTALRIAEAVPALSGAGH